MRNWFDTEMSTDKYGVYSEEGYKVRLVKLDGKTVLKYGSLVWVGNHMNTLGYAYAYLAYDSDKQQFAVVKAEYSPGERF